MLLFLVQNDQAGDTGGKHRRAGSHDHFRVAAPDALPLVVPFPRPKAAVQHRHLIAKIGRHQPQQLGRQCNFRHQKQGASARFQAGLDEFNIDGGLAGAGHAPQERDPRIFLRHLLGKSVIAALLIGAEHQRPIQLRRADFPAAKHRPLGQRQVSQLFQPVYRRGGSTGKIAKLLHGHAAHAAHQLQHIFLHGGRLGAVGGVLHGFLGGNRQGSDLLRLVIGAAQIFRFGGYPLFPREIRNHAGKGFLVGNQGAQGGFLRLTTQIFQQRKHLRRAVLADGFFLPGAVGGEGNPFPRLKPQPRREHDPEALVKGAEIPLPQKCRQPQLMLRQNRRFVQAPLHGFQLFLAACLHSENHALDALVGAAEGQLHPLTGLQGHSLGDFVGIGLVNGIGRGGNRDFRNHPSPHPFRFLFRRTFASPGKALLHIFFLYGSGKLAVRHFLNGHGHGLFRQVFLKGLGLGGDLTGAVRYQVHQQITAVHFLQQFSNRGV